ncbi:MFS transporter [Myxococcota bacterium]|nr:MFS transporter [Myxococcota bacterium]MBU1411149.1 MFS transporter [Myxococcota bacterium]MBU1509723.1 MFS transporter [Myxococcota bacterium]
MPVWLSNLAPILILLAAVAVVLGRLPKVDVGHTEAFRHRRILNWLPLGLLYAFLYMGRYNLEVAKNAFSTISGVDGSPVMGNTDFGIIFGIGTVVYGFSFIINGPLTDRIGGRISILLGAGGTIFANLMMGLASLSLLNQGPGYEFLSRHFVAVLAALFAFNMYFQSFGAVSIVKVNAAWFHVRERGVFGAIFGILISLGLYFAFDWSKMILQAFSSKSDPTGGIPWVFFVPTMLLGVFFVLNVLFVRDTPGQAGYRDFDTGDASSGDTGPRIPVVAVFKKMLTNPVVVTIALIEFCSGFLRQAIMQWFRTFAKQTNGTLGLMDGFVFKNWGLLLCVAGILGGVVAGVISDHVFKSRRGPVAVFLYGVMLLGAVALTFLYAGPAVGALVVVMSMAVIGVHGMLSGTASMDFGGKRNVGVAVGIIDGFVYLGTATMSLTYAFTLPKEQLANGKLVGPATDPSNWVAWPVAMIPVALIGLVLALRVWHAYPNSGQKKPAPEPAPELIQD